MLVCFFKVEFSEAGREEHMADIINGIAILAFVNWIYIVKFKT